jgi:hypothetical protein
MILVGEYSSFLGRSTAEDDELPKLPEERDNVTDESVEDLEASLSYFLM